MSEGHVRVFIERHSSQQVQKTESEDMKEYETVGLSGKIILFDGEYRGREINLFFAINPSLDTMHISDDNKQ